MHYNAKYNTDITHIIDKHDPEITKTIIVRPNTQWHKANLQQAKVIRRRQERRWNKSTQLTDLKAYASYLTMQVI